MGDTIVDSRFIENVVFGSWHGAKNMGSAHTLFDMMVSVGSGRHGSHVGAKKFGD